VAILSASAFALALLVMSVLNGPATAGDVQADRFVPIDRSNPAFIEAHANLSPAELGLYDHSCPNGDECDPDYVPPSGSPDGSPSASPSPSPTASPDSTAAAATP